MEPRDQDLAISRESKKAWVLEVYRRKFKSYLIPTTHPMRAFAIKTLSQIFIKT